MYSHHQILTDPHMRIFLIQFEVFNFHEWGRKRPFFFLDLFSFHNTESKGTYCFSKFLIQSCRMAGALVCGLPPIEMVIVWLIGDFKLAVGSWLLPCDHWDRLHPPHRDPELNGRYPVMAYFGTLNWACLFTHVQNQNVCYTKSLLAAGEKEKAISCMQIIAWEVVVRYLILFQQHSAAGFGADFLFSVTVQFKVFQ